MRVKIYLLCPTYLQLAFQQPPRHGKCEKNGIQALQWPQYEAKQQQQQQSNEKHQHVMHKQQQSSKIAIFPV